MLLKMEAAPPSSSSAANININEEENEEEEEEEEEYELASSAVDQMPPGFRFHPTDLEIITHYLLNKVIDTRFRAVAIREIDLNKCEPWDLPHKAAKMGENEWFFFFEKETKYPSGSRTNRATASGYWKATGKDREIYINKPQKQLVGMKKTLVFYKGRAPKGDKTNWVIHEYRLHGDFSAYNLSHHAKEKWVVCRVFHKRDADAIPVAGSVELARIDSFVDRCLVDSPTPPLPPLTDYSSLDLTRHKPSTLMMLSENKLRESHHQNDFPHLKTNGCTQYYSTPHIDSMLPFESPSSLANYQRQHDAWYVTNFPIKVGGGGDDKPNSRIVAADIYIGGKEPERLMCKMEPLSFNNSAICSSRNTDLSTEMGAAYAEVNCEKERESKQACEEEGLCFSPSISDMDSLWSY